MKIQKHVLIQATLAISVSSIIAYGAALAERPKSALVAHEWGTFTSLQTSDGKEMEGLHQEDEELPAFVIGRDQLPDQTVPHTQGLGGLAVHANGFSRLGQWAQLTQLTSEVNSEGPNAAPSSRPAPVPAPPAPPPQPWPHRPVKASEFDIISGTDTAITQKMETPVIYFYGARQPEKVQVDVDFPGGIITQYFPNVARFSPAIGTVKKVANGHVSWDLIVTPEKLTLPRVSPNSIWAPSRKVPEANFVTVSPESRVGLKFQNEKFVFYRGLGKFTTDLKITSGSNPENEGHDGGITLSNHSISPIPEAFLLRITRESGSISALGEVRAAGKLHLSEKELAYQTRQYPTEAFLQSATSQIQAALVRSGLYPDEATAMVNTWKHSYFLTPGLRVLYILPRSWTNGLLPLRIQPEPQELVRTLVGRVEIMTDVEENQLFGLLEANLSSNPEAVKAAVAKLGRFAEPKLRRVYELPKSIHQGPDFRAALMKVIHSL